MAATLLSVEGATVKVELAISLSGNLLEMEETIQSALNEAGMLATEQALGRFDTDGSPIVLGDVKWTTKGQEPKAYQTPYGEVSIERHVYQRAGGGKTYCPLEHDARIVVTSTPKFAKQVAYKYSQGSSVDVQRDLAENHGRAVARSYLQNVAEAVGGIAQAKEETWRYETPKLTVPIETVAIGLDGTCMLMYQDGGREAMVGTLSLYDAQGERQHTTYIGASPEYGKATFLNRLEREIAHIRQLYPQARYVGVADGAAENWTFLGQHSDKQILDFYHATSYLADAAEAAYPRDKAARQQWLEAHCHQLKHKQGAAGRILNEMKALAEHKLSARVGEKLEAAITYFSNHKHQMNYAHYRTLGLPIGSGVTEAACKTLVKKRLCSSGMRWKDQGARIVLSLRALVLTEGRWAQFWDKICQYGVPVFA
jgi:hypothetical protein